MIVRPNAHELLLGVSEDRLFGPVILFGAGGVATEVVRDSAVALPPARRRACLRPHAPDAHLQSPQRHIATGRLADLEAIADALVRLSQLVVDIPAVRELDVNPLLADETGIIALDARISIDPAQIAMPGPNPRLAIRPYPNQWEAAVETSQGLPRADQADPPRPTSRSLPRFRLKLSPEDIRFRFLAPRKEFSHKTNARFTQIDYARAMAFIALSMDQTEMWGVARLVADPDYLSAEYAVIVRSDLKGAGLGWTLMHHLIRYAESEGLRDMHGDVLAANERMLRMLPRAWLRDRSRPGGSRLRKVRLKLPLNDQRLGRRGCRDKPRP